MVIPSFRTTFMGDSCKKPRILVLEVRDSKNAKGAPIAWLLVERNETYRNYSPDDISYGASIHLHYEVILPKYSKKQGGEGHFEAGYSKSNNSMSLLSAEAGSGTVFLELPELKGHRIGTYLMNEIVTWAKQWPDANVVQVTLSTNQADEENKARRNRFYEQFNLRFDFSDDECREGRSQPILVKDLAQTDAWKENISELSMSNYLKEMLYSTEEISLKLEIQQRIVAAKSAELESAEANPIRWGIKIFFIKYSLYIFIATVIAPLIFLA